MSESTKGLTEERLGQIAVLFILKMYEKEGITFNPSTVKRDVHNNAKNLGIDTVESAESLKIIYQHVFWKTMDSLDSIIDSEKKKIGRVV